MVTIDNTVQNVGEFTIDRQAETEEHAQALQAGRRDYERAKQGQEVLAEHMTALEETLKHETGFGKGNLPIEPTVTEFALGDVTFSIHSIQRTKRPAYKEAVIRMEDYLSAIGGLVAEGRAVSGVAREGRNLYISVDTLLERYDTIVHEVMKAEVKHTITYDASQLAEEKPHEVTLAHNPANLTPHNAVNYVRQDQMHDNLAMYVKAYEKALTKGQRKAKKTIGVTSRSAYESKKFA